MSIMQRICTRDVWIFSRPPSLPVFFIVNVFLAPKGAAIEEQSMDGFKVTVGSYDRNPEADNFKVEVLCASGTKECTIKRTSEPLPCQIADLPSGTEVVVKVAACLKDSGGCSSAQEIKTRTTPARRYF